MTDETTDTPAAPAKKAPAKKLRVVLVGGDVDGKVRVFPVEKAERLIRQGHARR